MHCSVADWVRSRREGRGREGTLVWGKAWGGGGGRGHVLDAAAQSQGPHHVQGLGCLGGDREGAP